MTAPATHPWSRGRWSRRPPAWSPDSATSIAISPRWPRSSRPARSGSPVASRTIHRLPEEVPRDRRDAAARRAAREPPDARLAAPRLPSAGEGARGPACRHGRGRRDHPAGSGAHGVHPADRQQRLLLVPPPHRFGARCRERDGHGPGAGPGARHLRHRALPGRPARAGQSGGLLASQPRRRCLRAGTRSRPPWCTWPTSW